VCAFLVALLAVRFFSLTSLADRICALKIVLWA
jgi:hypothetical protein